MKINTDRLRLAVTASGMSQRQVARRVGVSDVSVSHWLLGWRTPNDLNLARLAAALDIPGTDLTDGGEVCRPR